ncbi:hypothetical protein ACLGL2_00910 [Parvimonas sp. G1641]|uniref:hypothetical protein n=1 Tax=Parvimonas sp. G1641 TaxID=3388846 RepID=UPI003980E06E
MLKKIKNFIQLKSDYEFLQQENERLNCELFQSKKLFHETKRKMENEFSVIFANEKIKNDELQTKLDECKRVEKLKEQNYTHKVVFKGYKTRYVTEKQFNEIKQVLTTVKDDELYVDVAGELFKIKDIEIVTTLENKGGKNEN